MKRIVICIAVLGIVFFQRATMGQDSPAYQHLKSLESAIGEWTAEFEIPPGHPEFGEPGEKAVFSGTWRWMLKKKFMVINMNRKVGDESRLSKEIIGWDAASGQIIHWIYNDRGDVGKGEWSVDGNNWTLRWSQTQPDKTVRRGISHMVKVDDDTLTWRATDMAMGDKALPDFPTITFKRKKE
jgi:hypothetical protein